MTQNRVEKRVPHFLGDMGVLLPLSLHGIKSRFAAPALSSLKPCPKPCHGRVQMGKPDVRVGLVLQNPFL